LGDARISGAPALQTGNDGHHYLLTAFHAVDVVDNTAQSLYFIGQTDSFAQSPQWNFNNIGGPVFWAGYHTITMDSDLDAAFSFTSFQPGSTIYPDWYTSKGFAAPGPPQPWSPLTGYGILYSANSQGSYTGKQSCSTQTTQRWGDYMSILWDPNFASPSEADAFWMVQEFTTGGSNQSTQFAPIQDPLPFFVGSSTAENECVLGAGHDCTVSISPPQGVQAGDVLLVALDLAENTPFLLPVPSGWTLLAASNLTGSPRQIRSYAGYFDTSWLAAHIYGTSEPSAYSFTHGNNDGTEFAALMVAYRGARSNLNNYTAYGFTLDTTSPISNFTAGTKPISPPAETELVTLIGADGGCDYRRPRSGIARTYG
jgi:hypothetical protein